MLPNNEIFVGSLSVAYGINSNTVEIDHIIQAIGGAFFDPAIAHSFICLGNSLYDAIPIDYFRNITAYNKDIYEYEIGISKIKDIRHRPVVEHLSRKIEQNIGTTVRYSEIFNMPVPNIHQFALLYAFRDMSLVDKANVVIFLRDNGYPFRQEVRGLSKYYIANIPPSTGQQSSFPPQQSSIEPAGDTPASPSAAIGVEEQIQAWTDILPNLRGAELTAAKLAIEKWRGKSHVEAYKAAIPNGCANDPREYVSKKKVTAEKVAADHHLVMPNWRSDT